MISFSDKPGCPPIKCRLGFTLVEMQIVMAIFSLVIAALVYVNIFGLRQDELVRSKLGASDQSRLALADMSREVRSARSFMVGNGTASSFTPNPGGGNAVQIYSTPDQSQYIQYFITSTNGSTNELRRIVNGAASSTRIAQYLTNSVFQTEDYTGSVQSNMTGFKPLLHVILNFDQFQYPLVKVGTGFYYNSYSIQYRLTTHAPGS